MGILGIRNRTENWKTAVYFSSYIGEHHVNCPKLVQRLLGKSSHTHIDAVHLELYWRGMRDHFHPGGMGIRNHNELATHYRRLFGQLRRRMDQYTGFQSLKDHNYDVREGNNDGEKNLANNLYHTEIDIVLDSPNHLFIGEAKHEMDFHANSKLILVHQLVRQYVMTKILVDLKHVNKKVVPFIVVDNKENIKLKHQVQFMLKQGWMDENNVLEWNDIRDLAS